jgi:hypothetical protein
MIRLAVLAVALSVLIALPGLARAQSAAPEDPPTTEASAEQVEAVVDVSIEALTQELRARDPQRRLAAVRALGEARDRSAVAALAMSLRSDPVPEVRIEAAQALSAYGAVAADALGRAAQSDANPQVRRIATTLARRLSPAPQVSAPASSLRGGADCEEWPDDSVQMARASRRLVASGWTVFALASLGTFLEGIFLMIEFYDPEIGWLTMIPIVGPVMTLSSGELEGMGTINLLAFMAQVGGMVVALVGHRLRNPERGRITRLGRRRRAPPSSERGEARSSESWGMAITPTGSGLSIAGWFR